MRTLFRSLMLSVLAWHVCVIGSSQSLDYWKSKGYSLNYRETEMLSSFNVDERGNVSKSTKGKFSYYTIKSKDYKEGILDKKGNLIIPIKYFLIVYHSGNGGYFEAKDSDGRVGIYSRKGDILLPAKYSGARVNALPSGGFEFIVTSASKHCGVVSMDGEEIISPNTYTYISHYKDYYYLHVGGMNGFVGVADESGKIIIPANYYTDILHNDGFFIVKKGNRAGVCDATGKLLFMTKYNSLSLKKDKSSKTKYWETTLGGSKGRISLNGDIIEEPSPTTQEKVVEKGDFAYVEFIDSQGNRGAKDKTGQILIPCEYDSILYSEKSQLFTVKKDEFYGIYNSDGKVIIPTGKYHGIYQSDGCFSVLYYDKEGLCSLDGIELVSPDKYESVRPFDSGRFLVSEGGLKGVLDSLNNVILPTRYTRISRMRDYYDVTLFDNHGLCTVDGIEIVPPIYDGILVKPFKDTDKSVIWIKNGDKQGVLAMDGNPIVPAEYFGTIKFSFLKGEHVIVGEEGLYKCVYALDGHVISQVGPEDYWQKYFDEGLSKYNEGSYSAAAKSFMKANEIREDCVAYYNTGVCNILLGEYVKAKEYMNSCLAHNPSNTLGASAKEHISLCNRKINEIQQAKIRQRQERAQAVYAVLGSILSFASTVQQINQMRYVRQNPSNYSSAFSGLTYYIDYSAPPVPVGTSAPAYDSSFESSSYDSSSSYSSHESSSSRSTNLCLTCGGLGKCDTCHGSGKRTDNMFGTGTDYSHHCGVCGGDGLCPRCHGVGRR